MKHYIHKTIIGAASNFNGAPDHAIYAHYNSYSNKFSFSYHGTTDGELTWCHTNRNVTTQELHALPIMGIRELEEESYQQRIKDEWVSTASPLISQYSSYSSIAAAVYDLLFSGELEVPQKGEN